MIYTILIFFYYQVTESYLAFFNNVFIIILRQAACLCVGLL